MGRKHRQVSQPDSSPARGSTVNSSRDCTERSWSSMTLIKRPFSTSMSNGSRGQLRLVSPRSCLLATNSSIKHFGRVGIQGSISLPALPAAGVTPKGENKAVFACLLLESGAGRGKFPGFATSPFLSCHLIPLLQASIMSLIESQAAQLMSCISQVWTMAALSIIINVQITYPPSYPTHLSCRRTDSQQHRIQLIQFHYTELHQGVSNSKKIPTRPFFPAYPCIGTCVTCLEDYSYWNSNSSPTADKTEG